MRPFAFALLLLSLGLFASGLVGDVQLSHDGNRSQAGTRWRLFGDSAAEAATTAVAGAEIIGPATIPTGVCTEFQIVAVGQDGSPIAVSSKTRVSLQLSSSPSAKLSAKSSCSKSRKSFSILKDDSSKTFYAIDSQSESFIVQPLVHSDAQVIYGTPFTFAFSDATAASPTPTPEEPTATPTPTPQEPTATPTPTGSDSLSFDYWEGCWYSGKYQALSFQLAQAATLILQGEMYNGSTCNPTDFRDQFNDYDTAISFGGFGYIYYFLNDINVTGVSVVWTFSDTSDNLLWSSGCINYSSAPSC